MEMRRIVAALVVCFLLSAGCSKQDPRPGWEPISTDPGEIGQPWPVLVGTYHDSVTILAFDDREVLFDVGRSHEHFRLDYRLRKVIGLGTSANQPRPSAKESGQFSLSEREGVDVISIYRPVGEKEISANVIRGEGKVAQTKDLSGLAFYEVAQDYIHLVYYNVAADQRSVWHVSNGAPGGSLSWSSSGRYLLEENGERLTVYGRAAGGMIGAVQGTKPSFAASVPYLVFQRPDGRPGILELNSGYNWPLVPKTLNYQPKSDIIWTPNGERLAILAGLKPEAGTAQPPYLLYLYDTKTGKLLQYPLSRALDPARCGLLLQADPKALPALLVAAPEISRKPLVAVDMEHYLVGSGNRLELMDSAARRMLIFTFPDHVAQIGFDEQGRRLWLITAKGNTVRLYAWRLPGLEYLKSVFPGRGDLTLGRLRLGDSPAAVRTLLGRPLGTESGPDPRHDNEPTDTWRYQDLSVTFLHGRLLRIVSSTPDLPTSRGITIGSTLQQIQERYGRPSYQIHDYLSYAGTVGSVDLKVAFNLDQRRRVTAMLVSRTTSPGKPPSPGRQSLGEGF